MSFKNEFILQQYKILSSRFGETIGTIADSYGEECLYYSILIFENLNRPKIIRVIENMLVRFMHMELSVGIAQVKSKTPLSDDESIVAMSDYFSRHCSEKHLKINDIVENNNERMEILYLYNPSRKYVDEIEYIYSVLFSEIYDLTSNVIED